MHNSRQQTPRRDCPHGTSPQAAQPNQYSLGKILLIWVSVTAPMALLSRWAAPFLIPRIDLNPGLIYWWLMIVGMMWQTVVAFLVLRSEDQRWTIGALKQRLWLQTPRQPSGTPNRALYGWVILGILFVALTSDLLGERIDAPFQALFPSLTLPDYANIKNLAAPEFHGQWGILGIALVSCLFNYILGEALLFHCVLLPKMEGVFGRWAWLANGVLFGLYHVHLIWALPSIILSNLAYSWPAQRYRSNWLAVLIHGFEGVVLLAFVLWVILGSGSPI